MSHGIVWVALCTVEMMVPFSVLVLFCAMCEVHYLISSVYFMRPGLSLISRRHPSRVGS